MKRFFVTVLRRATLGAMLCTAFAMVAAGAPVQAAPLGRATAAFDNARPDKGETAWGRLAADALKAAARSDVALLNAGALKRGALRAGPFEEADVTALLAFPDDEVVTMTLSGSQLRAALEYAVKDYATPTPRFLHGAGFVAVFDPAAPAGARLSSLRVASRAVADNDSFSVAMPLGLAQGGAGFYTVWDEAQAKTARRTGLTLSQAIAKFVGARDEVSPDGKARLSAR